MIQLPNRLKNSLAGLVGIAFLGVAGSAYAVPMAFNDMTLFDNVVSGQTIVIEGFESSPVGSLPTGTTDLGLFDAVLSNASTFNTIGAAAFSALPTTVFNMDLSNSPSTGAQFIDWNNFDVAGSIFGIGFTVDGFNSDGITINVNGTDVAFAGGSQVFIGVVDTSPITTIRLTSSDEFFNIDNVKIAFTSSTVPEPAALGLFGVGLIGLGFASRRRKTS